MPLKTLNVKNGLLFYPIFTCFSVVIILNYFVIVCHINNGKSYIFIYHIYINHISYGKQIFIYFHSVLYSTSYLLIIEKLRFCKNHSRKDCLQHMSPFSTILCTLLLPPTIEPPVENFEFYQV